jgi:hypothetical protein
MLYSFDYRHYNQHGIPFAKICFFSICCQGKAILNSNFAYASARIACQDSEH